MPRPPNPWYWVDRDAWYATVRGKRLRLAVGKDSRAEALAELARLLKDASLPVVSPSTLTVTEAVYRYLDECKRTRKPLTYEYYVQHLSYLTEVHGLVLLSALTPAHIESILARKRWATNTRRALIAVCKRLTRWSHDRGDIPVDVLAKLRKPPPTADPDVPEAGDVATIRVAITDPLFRDIFDVVLLTGCRVSEAYRVEAKHIDLDAGTWTFDGKTSGKTGKPRVVYLVPEAVEICRRAMQQHPTGSIFRSKSGKPWNRQILGQRMRILRKRLGLGPEVKLKGLRHLFVTDSLEKGVPIATVAELAGHSDTRMVSQVYSKLHKRTEHLRQAVNLIRGRESDGDRQAQTASGEGSDSAVVPVPLAAPRGSNRGKRRVDRS
jgi:integrase